MELSPLLLDAKKEYVIQLSYVLTPYVFQDIQGLSSGASARQFQDRLRGIPGWNDLTIQAKTADVEAKHPYLADLITACFVSWTKVMSSIKIHDNVNVRLALPRTATFVHTVYVNVAKELYERPHDIKSIDRVQKLELVREAIDTSIRALLPIHDIVKAYVAEPEPMPAPQPPGAYGFGEPNPMFGFGPPPAEPGFDPGFGPQAQAQAAPSPPPQPAPQPAPPQPAPQPQAPPPAPQPQAPQMDFNQPPPFDYVQQQFAAVPEETKTVAVPGHVPGAPSGPELTHAGPELFPDAEGDLF